jgi:hypothetical protein
MVPAVLALPAVINMPVMGASAPEIAPELVTLLPLSTVIAAPLPTLTLPPETIVMSPPVEVETGVVWEAEMLVCA